MKRIMSIPKFSVFFFFFFNESTITCKKGRLPKRHNFSIFPPCEFMADDLTLLFYLVLSNDGYWSWSKGAGGNWSRNSSMVKEGGFPLDPLTGVVYASYGSPRSIRGHLPSHHYCQTLFCRQADALFFPFCEANGGHRCTVALWALRTKLCWLYPRGSDDYLEGDMTRNVWIWSYFQRRLHVT